MFSRVPRPSGRKDARGRNRSGRASPRPFAPRPARGAVGGFTLIEVMAAFVIFGIGVLGVAQTAVLLSLQTSTLGSKSEVVLFSSQVMDSLRLEDMTAVAVGTHVDTLAAGGRDYLLSVNVSSTAPRLREVQVTSQLLDGSGEPMIFTSYITGPEETAAPAESPWTPMW